jgi:hypothetical protein
MNQLRYSYLLAVVRNLEEQTQTADQIAARILAKQALDYPALALKEFEQLNTSIQSSANLAREIALQIPMIAEVSYD